MAGTIAAYLGGSARASATALGGDGSVKQCHDRGVHCPSSRIAIRVHPCCDCGAVIKQQQPSTQLSGVACTGGLGELREKRQEPGTVLRGNDLARIAPARLSGGADEPTPSELRSRQELFNLRKNADNARSRRVMCR